MAKVLQGDFSQKKPEKKQESAQQEPVCGFQLKLSLPFSDPLIWRRLRVSGRLSLADMHRVIQASFCWNDTDSHQFLVGKIFYQPGFGIEEMTRKPEYDEARYQLHQLKEGMQFIFTYLYDGGDGWEVEIETENVLAPGEADAPPRLLAGERSGPPEETGDIHRYQQLLLAGEQAAAPETQFRLEIPGQSEFYPHICDIEAINDTLAAASWPPVHNDNEESPDT